MKSKLRSALESVIQCWIEEESLTWDVDGFIHEDLAGHMADAAEAVFDATIASSKFTDSQHMDPK